MPAVSPISDPEFAANVAQMLADGLSRREIADHLGIKNLDTITRWKRDPRIKGLLTKLINERVQEVTRKVDSVIAGRLSQAEGMTVRELLDIRKEFLNGALRDQVERVDDDLTNKAMEAFESPEFREEFERMFQAPPQG